MRQSGATPLAVRVGSLTGGRWPRPTRLTSGSSASGARRLRGALAQRSPSRGRSSRSTWRRAEPSLSQCRVRVLQTLARGITGKRGFNTCSSFYLTQQRSSCLMTGRGRALCFCQAGAVCVFVGVALLVSSWRQPGCLAFGPAANRYRLCGSSRICQVWR